MPLRLSEFAGPLIASCGKRALSGAFSLCLTDHVCGIKIAPSAAQAAQFISTMYDCTYGDPVNAQGNTPTGSSTPFAFSTSTCNLASTTISTSTDIVLTPGISAGEFLISTLLFLLLIIMVLKSVVQALGPVKAWLPRREKYR